MRVVEVLQALAIALQAYRLAPSPVPQPSAISSLLYAFRRKATTYSAGVNLVAGLDPDDFSRPVRARDYQFGVQSDPILVPGTES